MWKKLRSENNIEAENNYTVIVVTVHSIIGSLLTVEN
jgi:hypothetical protein